MYYLEPKHLLFRAKNEENLKKLDFSFVQVKNHYVLFWGLKYICLVGDCS